MALTDLLKKVGRALTLTAALYNCGGEEKEGGIDKNKKTNSLSYNFTQLI